MPKAQKPPPLVLSFVRCCLTTSPKRPPSLLGSVDCLLKPGLVAAGVPYCPGVGLKTKTAALEEGAVAMGEIATIFVSR